MRIDCGGASGFWATGLGTLSDPRQLSRNPNVGWMRLFDEKVIRFTALRDIEEGEELLICYGSSSLVSSWMQQDDDDDDKSESDEEENQLFLQSLSPEE